MSILESLAKNYDQKKFPDLIEFCEAVYTGKKGEKMRLLEQIGFVEAMYQELEGPLTSPDGFMMHVKYLTGQSVSLVEPGDGIQAAYHQYAIDNSQPILAHYLRGDEYNPKATLTMQEREELIEIDQRELEHWGIQEYGLQDRPQESMVRIAGGILHRVGHMERERIPGRHNLNLVTLPQGLDEEGYREIANRIMKDDLSPEEVGEISKHKKLGKRNNFVDDIIGIYNLSVGHPFSPVDKVFPNKQVFIRKQKTWLQADLENLLSGYLRKRVSEEDINTTNLPAMELAQIIVLSMKINLDIPLMALPRLKAYRRRRDSRRLKKRGEN